MESAATPSAPKLAPTKVGKYVQEIQAMMYTFGDVRSALPETAELIEDVLHGQLVDIVLKAASLAQRRGSKSISQDDLMFVIRHDISKLQRLREFLNWKDVRKNVKQSEETNASNATATVPFDVEAVAEDEDDNATETMSVLPSKQSKPAGQSSQQKATSKKRSSHYYWDCLSSLVAEATEGSILDTEPIDLDEELEDTKEEGQRRLREADRITRSMTKAEYMEYTECRQASFTYKKAKKFRDWLGIPLTVTEYRLGDEVLEILGFLAAEIVRQMTEGALKYRRLEPAGTEEEKNSGGTGLVVSLFKAPQQKSPIRPEHLLLFLNDKLLYNRHSRIKLY